MTAAPKSFFNSLGYLRRIRPPRPLRPLLKRVIVVAGERLAMQPTLAEALAARDWYGFGRAMQELNEVLGE